MTTARRVLVAGFLALGAGLVDALRRRHRRIGVVSPELRTAALWAPLPVGPRVLPLLRRAFAAARPQDDDAVHRRVAPGHDGAPDVTVWVHEPASRPRPSAAVLWIHGGGLVMGSPVTDQPLCRRLADDLGAVVVSVTYRLAPEHPAPAALEDCATALAWLHDAADELGIDPGRIAVAGQSAGGGLAAALTQLAHDHGGLPLAFQALVYPMLDDRTVRHHDRATGHFVWTPRANRFGWSSYLGHDVGSATSEAEGTGSAVAPYAVPARRDDLAGLPPAWIGVGDLDLFRDEDVRYAERLVQAGVPCELRTVPGMYHGADVLCAGAPSMVAFHASWTDALRRALATG